MTTFRTDLCRKCGAEMAVYESCELCNMILKFICPKCGNITDDLLHYHSIR
ncbi:MAG: hypothetical protein WAO91_00315 [Candidatus Nitrosotenuis sp.]